MPDILEEFTVKAPIQKAWQLLSNMEKMGLCIPGCQEVKRISETEYEWVMQAKILFATKTIKARTKAVELNPPVHVSFVGNGALTEGFNLYNVTVQGTMDLDRISEEETRVKFAGKVSASGMGGKIINKIASGQMKEILLNFERNVRSKLEA